MTEPDVEAAFHTLDKHLLEIIDRATDRQPDGWVMLAWILVELTGGEEIPGMEVRQVIGVVLEGLKRLVAAEKLTHKATPAPNPERAILWFRRVNVLERVAEVSSE